MCPGCYSERTGWWATHRQGFWIQIFIHGFIQYLRQIEPLLFQCIHSVQYSHMVAISSSVTWSTDFHGMLNMDGALWGGGAQFSELSGRQWMLWDGPKKMLKSPSHWGLSWVLQERQDKIPGRWAGSEGAFLALAHTLLAQSSRAHTASLGSLQSCFTDKGTPFSFPTVQKEIKRML